MKIVHTIPQLSISSGSSQAAISLTGAMAGLGETVAIYTLDSGQMTIPGVKISRFPQRHWRVPHLGWSPQMFHALQSAAPALDIVHVHGLWTMTSIYPLRLSCQPSPALVLSPHGMLHPQAMAYSRWKKWLSWNVLGQRRLMEETSCLVATSTEEMEHVRRLGYTRPIAVVPNGVNLTDQHRTPAPGRRRVLFLGRLHPIKGLENFLRAWTQVEPSHPDWDLVIAGPEVTPGYRDSLRRLSEELGCRRVRFQAEVSGPEKITLLCQASLLVLPSLSENFGVVVTEALSLGLPVMASSGTPWAGLVSHGCGWWVPLQEEAWVGALHDALGKMETELTQMGNCGREWIRQEFQWSRIAAMMIDLYAWLRNPKGNRPDFVCI